MEIVKEAPSMHREVYNQIRYVFDTNPSTSVGIRTQAGQFMSQIKPLLKPLDWGEGTKAR